MATLVPTITAGERVGGADGRLQATFWRSPFAIAAALSLAAQGAMLGYGAMVGRSVPYEVMFCLAAMSGMYLAAGLWPDWNYLEVTDEGLDQQAGLRGVTVAWADVQSVRGFEGWVELRVVVRQGGRRRVKTVSVFDRYGLGADAFTDLIETPWLKARRAPAF